MQKRPISRTRNQHPYPFSAYILKSYSTEHSKKISAQEVYENSSIKTSIKQVNQYLNILEINSRIQKQPLVITPAVEFITPEVTLKKHPQSEKVKVLGIDSQSPSPQNKPNQHRLKMKSLSPVKKKRPIENPKIYSTLRYQLISLYSLLSRREDYMNFLKGKQEQLSTPLKNSELDEIFTKLQETKGRDKGRVKFNYITNQQLRSLKYKARNPIIQSTSPSKKEEKEKVHYDQD